LQGGAALSVLLKRESQGDFAADYCFDTIVSKISASTTVGVPSLSALRRERPDAARRLALRSNRVHSLLSAASCCGSVPSGVLLVKRVGSVGCGGWLPRSCVVADLKIDNNAEMVAGPDSVYGLVER
jgi:hypothetical protein